MGIFFFHPFFNSQFSGKVLDFTKKIEDYGQQYIITEKLIDCLTNEITLEPIERTPILKYKKLNALLNKYNIISLPEDLYKSRINQVASLRNLIAHGTTEIIIDRKRFIDNSTTVIDAMGDLFIHFIDAFHRDIGT